MSTFIISLSVNQLPEPSGVVTPTFGWKMQSSRQGAAQAAYRITLWPASAPESPVWDSGEVASSCSFAIPYAGPALKPATAYGWRVAVKDEKGAWTESSPSRFATALDESTLANALWISAATPVRNDFDSSIFVKTVPNAREVRDAFWFVTGQGVFEAYVDGEPVSHRRLDGTLVRDSLKPGFTHCGKRRHYFSYDITHLVKRGAGESNTFSAIVTGGWWRDQITGHQGLESAFRAVLILRYADGTEEKVFTDTTWMSAYGGPVVKAEIFYGEDYDARYEAAFKAAATGANPSSAVVASSVRWAPARVNTEFKGETLPFKGWSIRQRDDIAIAPASIRVWSGVEGADDDHYGHVCVVREYRDGDDMVVRPGENLQIDFGQNAAAVPDFAFSANGGVRLKVRVAEMLNDGNGAISRHNDGPEGELYKDNYRDARAEIHYLFKGGEATYRPRFAFLGYRYISISVERGAVTIHRVRSIPVTSVAAEAETGSIETANPLLNRLIANGIWGQRSNYLSVPTDCPQRNERLGWTADTQVFTPTACYNANVYPFLLKWMDDMRDSRSADGSFPGVAPTAQYGDLMQQLGWADAGVIVPWTLWRHFGDTAVIEENWDAMRRYVDLLEEAKFDSPTAREHQWGDWLSYEKLESCGGGAYETLPDGTRRPSADALAYWQYLGCCYWLSDALMMADMADATGRADEVRALRDMAGRARDFLRTKFVDPADGMLIPLFRDMQTPALFALRLDLLDDAPAAATRDALLDNIRAHGDCLQTGFLGTSILMDTLTKIGAVDVAYTLLLQRKNPSWLYSVDQGATTFWERWNSYTKESGFGNAGMNSFNHYAYGAVIAWFYSTMAGIRTDAGKAGFAHFTLQPRPDKRIPSVKAAYESPYGKIESAWEYAADGTWHWRYTIPANTTATVVLPDGGKVEQGAGTYECARP